QMTIPDYCYTISPMIRLKSGFRRIESVVEDYIQNQTHTWAVESRNTLEEEMALLNHFYTNMEGCEEQQAQMKKEKEEIRSEEHTSELQSSFELVCRLLIEKKKRPQEEI